jgi:hypothetical protein
MYALRPGNIAPFSAYPFFSLLYFEDTLDSFFCEVVSPEFFSELIPRVLHMADVLA